MPDRPRIPAPRDWGEAFAALPQESPGNDGWQRLTRALDGAAVPAHAASRSHAGSHSVSHASSRRRARWPVWLAAAAAVSAIAMIPLLRQDEAPVQADADRVADVATQVPSPSTSAPVPAAGDASPAITPPSPAPASVATTTPADRTAARRKPAGMPTRKPAPAALPSPVRNDNGTRVADVDPAAPAAPAATGARDVATSSPSATSIADSAVALQALQTESAQLEALVALARDERVSSASGAALGVELDERIGRIDAALSQPGLPDSERTGLWQQRVEAMRELAGIETTQRWLVTRGERYDGALVNVD